MAAKGSYAITKLGESNYKTWKMDITDVLLNEELWTIVSGKDKGPTGGPEDKRVAWESCAVRAATIIRLAMEDKVRARYTAEELVEDPVALWKKIVEDHQALVFLDKNYLITQLHKVKLEEHCSISAYVDAIEVIIDNLAPCGKKVDDDTKWFYLTNSLPSSWAVFKEVLEGPGSSAKRDIPGLVSRMLAKEAQLEREEGIGTDSMLYAKRASGGSWKRDGRQDTRTTGSECFYCSKAGHKLFECHEFKADRASDNLKTRGTTGANAGGKQASGSGRAQSSAAKVTGNVMWVPQELCALAQTPGPAPELTWIVDSGCSCHLTGRRSLFVLRSYVEYVPGEHQIPIADNGVRGAAGYGDVVVNVCGRGGSRLHVVTVHSILHMPSCQDNNILPMGQLEDLGIGFNIGLRKGEYYLVRNGVIVAEMDRVSRIYLLRTGGADVALGVKEGGKQGEAGSVALWHFRLGQLGMDAVEKLGRARGRVPAIEQAARMCVCEAFLSRKMRRRPFVALGEDTRAVGLLDVIHSDLIKLMEVPSISGARYVLLYVDDRSWYKHCFILKKSEVFVCFKEYKALVEQETGRKIGKLRTDGGREETLSELFSYLCKKGIVKQTTTPLTPQLNGVSERANRTIMETAKARMFAAAASKEYWAKAITMAVYLRYLTPTHSIRGGSPFEALYGKRQNLAHLRVWGCVANVRIPKENLRTLDANMPKCTFVVYTATRKPYNLYDHVNKKVTLLRDVEFEEKMS